MHYFANFYCIQHIFQVLMPICLIILRCTNHGIKAQGDVRNSSLR